MLFHNLGPAIENLGSNLGFEMLVFKERGNQE